MTAAWQQLKALADQSLEHHKVTTRQTRWLKKCLQRNCDTAYGTLHDFADISDIGTYQERVPLTNYENLRPHIARIQGGEPNVLFSGRAVAFETTGGSSGGSKMIPYSEHSLIDFRAAIMPWLANVINNNRINDGTAYFSISPACRTSKRLPSGIPVGLPDGAYLGEDILRLFSDISATPPWLAELTALSDWQLATLYFMILHQNLKLISIWSPTFLTALLDSIDIHADTLLQLFLSGGQLIHHTVTPDLNAHTRLSRYLIRRDPATIWPHLKLVSCWTEGSSRPFFDELQHRFSGVPFQKKGLLSTEAVVTVPDSKGRCLLTADSGFYEFLDERGTIHSPDTLVAGQKYEVIITTSGGLYRYRSGDIVRAEGYVSGVPELSFMGRCGLTSDLVGEKLNDVFVDNCLHGISGFRMLVPTAIPIPHYILLLDASINHDLKRVTAKVEERLSKNPQYAYARQMGQLDSLTHLSMTHPVETHANLLHKEGVRLGDIKLPALSGHSSWNQYIELQI